MHVRVGGRGNRFYSLLIYLLRPSSVPSKVTSACPTLLQIPNTLPQDTTAIPDPSSPISAAPRPFMQKCPLRPRNASAQELTTAPGSYHMKLKLLALDSWALMIQELPACPTVTDSSGQYGQPALPRASLVPTALTLLSELHWERSSRSLARPHSLSHLLFHCPRPSLGSAAPGVSHKR